MHIPLLYRFKSQQCWLSPDRAVFWEEQQALILSDLHFGKTGHFRKAGIAVPQPVFTEDLQRLVQLLQYFQPRRLVAVGDLFHSAANKELDLFRKWRHDFPQLAVQLVKGNHDILAASWYEDMGIEVHDDTLDIPPFSFCHDCETIREDEALYTFTGHLHPGIRISGTGKQALQLPCFYFTAHHCILPAFSRFTGLAMIRPARGEGVFAIAGKEVLQIQ